MTTTPRLACNGLRVTYGDTVAVDDVSFRVDEGEVFGLLGPNGAGKTSAIRALTTIVRPAAGTASVAGADLADHAAIRARIGVLPESSGYPGSQTAPSYLRFHGRLFGLTAARSERRAEELLARLGLAGNTNRIATYSRGMRQRLGLCRAMMNDPQVLFLDEPTLGLDPSGKRDILLELVEAATNRGTAVVLCTHLLDEVERVCDRVAILATGQTIAEGTVTDVISASGVGGVARVNVDPTDVGRATTAIRARDPGAAVSFDNTQPGRLEVALGAESGHNVLLETLLGAEVEVRSFELEQATLNDAFLALTRGLDLGRQEAAR